MLFGGQPPLETGERRVVAVRAHRWIVVRAALPLLLIALAPVLYSALDVAVPSLQLAALFGVFIWVVAGAFALYLLKWLFRDLLPWSQRIWVLTDRRVIAQSGVVAVHRRECSLLKIQESDYSSRGLMARLFDIGDVEVETMGSLGAIILHDVAHPRRVQSLISAQARALREDVTRQRLAETPDEVVRQLEAVVSGLPNPHTALTTAVRTVSPRAAQLQQRLSLLPDETVVAVIRQHSVVLSVGLFPPLAIALFIVAGGAIAGPAALPVAAGAALLILVPWVLWRIATYLEHEYVLTTDRLMELRSTPLVFQMRDIVQLAAVQDVALEIPTIFGRLAAIGDVVVEVAGPDERVVLKTVAHPSEIQRLIFETIDNRQRQNSERDDQRLVSTLGRWFKEYHRLQQGDADQP